jgi:Ca2+-binding RTX toxin-like protein
MVSPVYVGTDGDDHHVDAEPVMYGLGGDDILDALDPDTSYALYGGEGDDALRGFNQGDYLFGGRGKDNLVGFGGNDWLEGGPGHDVFWFEYDGTPGKDTIVDFRVGEDLLAFDTDSFSGLGGDGTLAKKKFYVGSHAHDGSDRVIYDDQKGKLIYDSNGDKKGHQTVVAVLDKHLDLAHNDIMVGDTAPLFA